MNIVVITQDGRPYKAFTCFDFASDEMLKLQRGYPWYEWRVQTIIVDPTEARVKSTA